MSKIFLVAVDGADHGWKALDLATDMASVSDAEVRIVHVVPYEPTPEAFRQLAQAEGISVEETSARYHFDKKIGDKIVKEAEARVRRKGITTVTTRVSEGKPANEILALAQSGWVDMIFLGSRGVSDLAGLILGSVSHKVMHLAPCTCVVVR
jgi:nucleotide-binding universal stress UspA family protein